MTEFLLERLESIVGKDENAGYQHFLCLPQPKIAFPTLYLVAKTDNV